MTTDWMITAYRPYSERVPSLWKWFKPKAWIVAVEGLKPPMKPHLQIRIKTSKTEKEVKEFVETYGVLFNGIDIRLAEPKDFKEWQYERKENVYLCSWDTEEVRATRRGRPYGHQIQFLDRLNRQSDRGITVWYNRSGNHGKSWLCNHLWENGRCTYLMVTSGSADRIIKDAVSAYDYSGIIIVDLGRDYKWNGVECEVFEHLKDGLIRDDRYSNRTINIRGVKIGVLTNTKPKLNGLSADRWDIMET